MWISIRNEAKNKICKKKTLSDRMFAILRPLYNSNMAKVSIVKVSHDLIFVERNPFFYYPMI